MKLPKIKFDFKKALSQQKNSDWQKSIYVILIIATFAFIGILIFIYLKPASQEIKDQVKNDITTEEIKLDTKTLEMIKKKDYPQ